jgi:hypothetical protein
MMGFILINLKWGRGEGETDWKSKPWASSFFFLFLFLLKNGFCNDVLK